MLRTSVNFNLFFTAFFIPHGKTQPNASSFDLWVRTGWLTGDSGLLINLFLLDFAIYWWHRANHEISFLWRFHQVHHLDEQLDTTSAVRFHFGEVLLSALLRAVIIITFAIPFTSVIVFETLVVICAFFHHSMPAR